MLGDSDRVTDLREERGGGEPDEEGDEKTPPGKVKGAHVRAGKGAELDLFGTVVLVGIDLDVVFTVRLPLLL